MHLKLEQKARLMQQVCNIHHLRHFQFHSVCKLRMQYAECGILPLTAPLGGATRPAGPLQHPLPRPLHPSIHGMSSHYDRSHRLSLSQWQLHASSLLLSSAIQSCTHCSGVESLTTSLVSALSLGRTTVPQHARLLTQHELFLTWDQMHQVDNAWLILAACTMVHHGVHMMSSRLHVSTEDYSVSHSQTGY